MSPEYEPCPWKPCLFLFQYYCTSIIICIFVWPALAYLALCLLWLIILVLAHVFVILITVGGDFPSQFFYPMAQWLVIIPMIIPDDLQKHLGRKDGDEAFQGGGGVDMSGLNGPSYIPKEVRNGKEIRR